MSDSSSEAQDSVDEEEEEEEPEYDVERILAEASNGGPKMYLVKWLGYDEEQCTWEPAESFQTTETLADWERQLANHDTLDEEEVARLQARMDAYQQEGIDQKLAREGRLSQKTPGKRTRESGSSPTQPMAKRPRASSSAGEQRAARQVTNPKKGIARAVQPAPRTAAGSDTLKRRSIPVSALRKHPELAMSKKASAASATSKTLQSKSNKSDIPPLPSRENGPRYTSKLHQTEDNPRKATATSSSLQNPTQSKIEKHGMSTASDKTSDMMTGREKMPRPPQTEDKIKRTTSTFSMHRTLQSNLDEPKAQPAINMTSIPQNGRKNSHAEAKAGQRFNSLSHQNNYMKKARREPAPDISKIDLRSPEEFGQSGVPPTSRTDGAHRRGAGGSPLFVPESDEDLHMSIDTSPAVITPRSPKTHSAATRPQPSTSHQNELTVLASDNLGRENGRTDMADVATTRNPPTSDGQLGRRQAHDGTNIARSAAGVSGLGELHIPREQQVTAKNAKLGGALVPERPPPERTTSTSINAHTASRSGAVQRKDSLDDRTSTDKFSLHQSSSNATHVGDDILIANNGRSYRKGEIIVGLRFGDHVVGDVKFVNLPRWTSTKILYLKEPHRAFQLHFSQMLVVTEDQYTTLSDKIDNRRHGIAAIEPYDDTRQATESLIQHLEGNNLGAIWEYPDPGETLILVLYCSGASGWRHLERSPLLGSTSRLHLAVLNKVPGVSLEEHLPRSSQAVPQQQNTRPVQPEADVLRTQLRLSTSNHAIDQFQSLTKLVTPMTITSLTRIGMTPLQTSKSPDLTERRAPMLFEETEEWTPSTPAANSQVTFSANYDDMVNGLDRSKGKPRVFISFAKSHPSEAMAVKEWLTQHLPARLVFSDDQDGDWSEFTEDTNTLPGIILFHDSYPCYSEMPRLFKRFRSASTFCYNLRFHQTGRVKQGHTITRLFPRGNVLCMTEDTIINHPEAGLSAMQWFGRGSFNKEQYWRLVLPPDSASLILLRANAAQGEGERIYMKMLELLQNLRLRWSEVSSTRRQQHEDPERFIKDMSCVEDDQLIMSPKGLPGYGDWNNTEMKPDAISYRDRNLLGFFAGWSALHASKYRQFTVIDANHTNRTEKYSCHIWFRQPAAYLEDYKKRPSERKS